MKKKMLYVGIDKMLVYNLLDFYRLRKLAYADRICETMLHQQIKAYVHRQKDCTELYSAGCY